jgi:hypothetical protein
LDAAFAFGLGHGPFGEQWLGLDAFWEKIEIQSEMQRSFYSEPGFPF